MHNSESESDKVNPSWLRRYIRSFSFLGLLLGSLFFAASVTPSLLPRTFLVQGLLSGLSLAVGYGFGVACIQLWRFLEFPLLSQGPARTARTFATTCSVYVVVTFLWRSTEWQNSIRRLMKMPEVETAYPLQLAAVAVVFACLLIAFARILYWAFTLVADKLNEVLPKRVSAILSFIAVSLLLLFLINGVFAKKALQIADAFFLRTDGLVDDGIEQPTSILASGSMAAHLALNWHRYTGSEQDYDEAAAELLDFVRLDVRNRVVRRFPLAAMANGSRWILGQGRSRRLTRPGLLEAHYERFLYGDKCLYELPVAPQLHMLATNINEGCLCSFTRSGILAQRRISGGGARFELVPRAMATISMAVTASSAFPGFFTPLQLTAHDVGAEESQFPPHLFTDGGVYDNLGVRMFRHIQESWIGRDTPLRPDDFVDIHAAAEVLRNGMEQDANTPLGRLGRLVSCRTG